MDKENKILVMALRQGKYIDVQSETLDEAFKEYIIFQNMLWGNWKEQQTALTRTLQMKQVVLLGKVSHCNICSYNTSIPNHMKGHLWKHTCQYYCDQCNMKFQTLMKLNNHKPILGTKTSTDCSLKCDECYKAFNKESELEQHVIKVHQSPTSFTCEQCGNKIKCEREIMNHKGNVQGQGKTKTVLLLNQQYSLLWRRISVQARDSQLHHLQSTVQSYKRTTKAYCTGCYHDQDRDMKENWITNKIVGSPLILTANSLYFLLWGEELRPGAEEGGQADRHNSEPPLITRGWCWTLPSAA